MNNHNNTSTNHYLRSNKNLQTTKSGLELQIPSLPLIKTLSQKEVVDALLQSITEEAKAIDFYYRLLKYAPNAYCSDTISEIISDEEAHLKAFTQLYIYLTSRKPAYSFNPVKFNNFKDGLFLAYEDEIEAAEFYKQNILSTMDQLIIDTYFFAMTDEQEHALQFLFLYFSTN